MRCGPAGGAHRDGCKAGGALAKGLPVQECGTPRPGGRLQHGEPGGGLRAAAPQPGPRTCRNFTMFSFGLASFFSVGAWLNSSAGSTLSHLLYLPTNHGCRDM